MHKYFRVKICFVFGFLVFYMPCNCFENRFIIN